MRTNFLGQTDRRTDRPKSSTLYPAASRGIINGAAAAATHRVIHVHVDTVSSREHEQ